MNQFIRDQQTLWRIGVMKRRLRGMSQEDVNEQMLKEVRGVKEQSARQFEQSAVFQNRMADSMTNVVNTLADVITRVENLEQAAKV